MALTNHDRKHALISETEPTMAEMMGYDGGDPADVYRRQWSHMKSVGLVRYILAFSLEMVLSWRFLNAGPINSGLIVVAGWFICLFTFMMLLGSFFIIFWPNKKMGPPRLNHPEPSWEDLPSLAEPAKPDAK